MTGPSPIDGDGRLVIRRDSPTRAEPRGQRIQTASRSYKTRIGRFGRVARMTMHANSSFVIDRWEETVVLDEPGAKFVRTAIAKTFTGDIVGTSVAEATMAHAQEGSAAYVAFERFTVTIGERKGNFVLHHNASATKDGRAATWTILTKSGTGDLAGIYGSATITRLDDGSHTFALDYAFE